MGQRVGEGSLFANGPAAQISSPGSSQHDSSTVVYNSREKEYFVTWIRSADDGLGGAQLVAQRIRAANNTPIEAEEIVLSDAGAESRYPNYAVWNVVAYHLPTNRYLCVWVGTKYSEFYTSSQVLGQFYRPYLTDLYIGVQAPMSATADTPITYRVMIANQGGA